MKSLILAFTVLTLLNLKSQDFWEPLDLPSNQPVMNLTFDDDGSIFASGLGIYRLNNGEWESKNRLKTDYQGVNFDGILDELGMPIFDVVILENNTLVSMIGEGLVIKSTDYGDNWNIISDEVSRPKLVTKHNGIPYFVGREGVYKLDTKLESVISLIGEDIHIYDVIQNGSKIILQYYKAIEGESVNPIKIFDLETETIIDSVELKDYGMEGKYYENGTNAYIVDIDTLYVLDRVLRSGAEPVITAYDLKEVLDPDRLEKFGAYFSRIRFFDSGKLLLPNLYNDDYIVADPQFKNPKAYSLIGIGNKINWSIMNIYPNGDDYLVCSDLGLFRAKNKDLENLEHISNDMGTGIFESVFENEGGYFASLSNLLYRLEGNNLEIINGIDNNVRRWNNALWYQVEDSIFITKDFGKSWKKHVFTSKSYENELRSHTNDKFTITGSDSIYIINYNDLSIIAIGNPQFTESYSEVMHIAFDDNLIYAISSEGTFKYSYAEGWTKVSSYTYQDDLLPLLGFGDKYIEIIDGKLIGFSDWFVFYSEDYGKTNEEYGLTLPSNPDQKYIRLGDKFYLYASKNEDKLYDFYELSIDEQNGLSDKLLSNDNTPSIFQSYSLSKDGRIIISGTRGNYISKQPLLSSVEQNSYAVAEELLIYPNISDSRITVITDGLDKSDWTIYDLNGNRQDVIIDSNNYGNIVVNISNLSIGKYIISKVGQSGFFFKR